MTRTLQACPYGNVNHRSLACRSDCGEYTAPPRVPHALNPLPNTRRLKQTGFVNHAREARSAAASAQSHSRNEACNDGKSMRASGCDADQLSSENTVRLAAYSLGWETWRSRLLLRRTKTTSLSRPVLGGDGCGGFCLCDGEESRPAKRIGVTPQSAGSIWGHARLGMARIVPHGVRNLGRKNSATCSTSPVLSQTTVERLDQSTPYEYASTASQQQRLPTAHRLLP